MEVKEFFQPTTDLCRLWWSWGVRLIKRLWHVPTINVLCFMHGHLDYINLKKGTVECLRCGWHLERKS